MVKLSAVNRTIIGSSPIIKAKRVCSSIGRISVSKTEDEGSSPYMSAIIPEWWNGIHGGLRNRVERRVGSSPTLGTYCPLV